MIQTRYEGAFISTIDILSQYAKIKAFNAGLYLLLVLVFPFSVLFCPRLSVRITHIRADELLVFIWFPFALWHYIHTAVGSVRRCNMWYFHAFFAIFVLFLFGIIWGDDVARWSQSNLKLVTRPFVAIMNILVLRYWILRSRVKFIYLIAGLVVAVTFAGGLGYIAMTRPALSEMLVSLYSSDLELYDDNYSFDMSRRAMSVFTGYDQAAMTYAMGIMACIFLLYSCRTFRGKSLSITLIFSLLVAVVSSARIGFVSLIFGMAVFFLLSPKRNRGRIVRASILMGIILYVIVIFGPSIFQNIETTERFSDVFNIFDSSSSDVILERSQGLSGVLQTQVYGIRYPSGMDVIFGLGDNGEFVSDAGFVTVFVKYGLVGIAVLLCSLFMIGLGGYKIGKKSQALGVGFTVSAILPGLMMFFMIGSMKGGLYFLTYKIGELFAYLLAICVVEGEMIYARKNSPNEAGTLVINRDIANKRYVF